MEFASAGSAKEYWCTDELSCIHCMHLKVITALIERKICQPLTATISGPAQNAHERLHTPHRLGRDGQTSRKIGLWTMEGTWAELGLILEGSWTDGQSP